MKRNISKTRTDLRSRRVLIAPGSGLGLGVTFLVSSGGRKRA